MKHFVGVQYTPAVAMERVS